MTIYLPIAELPVNIWLLIFLGLCVGILSGLLGVGGGFMMTPMLIFLGIPAAVAVGSEAVQILATALSGFLAHRRRGNVDFVIGTLLLSGGVLGSVTGVFLFAFVRSLGQIDLVIRVCYVLFLGLVGSLMLIETTRVLLRRSRSGAGGDGEFSRRRRKRTWLDKLPLRIKSRRSRLYISALEPIFIGYGVGILAAMIGVSGGFILVPAMIYLLKMPTRMVIGTSLFQIIFVSATTTFLQSTVNQTVDITLAFFLLIGGVMGAQIGTRWAGFVNTTHLRLGLAVLVLLVALRLMVDLLVMPESLFQVEVLQ